MSSYLIEKNHPYGIGPGGTAFLGSSKTNHRSYGLGRLRMLTDELLLDIFCYCSARDLVRLLTTSRMLYVLAHHCELWRDLTLQKSGRSDFQFISSWKDTYANLTGTVVPHKPLSLPTIGSDLLYRSWVTREFDLETACPGFFRHNDIERRHISTLTPCEFVREYESKNIPLVIEGEVTTWPAYKLWTKDYLERVCGSKRFRATSATASHAASFTISKYNTYAELATEEVPLYLFERGFATVNGLQEGFTVPPMFCPPSNTPPYNCTCGEGQKHASDLFSVFGEIKRPDYRWLIMGPRRSGSIFHIDPNQTNAWNASIRGRKKWVFYPPSVTPPGVVVSKDGADVIVPLSTGEWLLSFWQHHLEARRDPDPSKRPLEVIVEPGEMIFVPHNWWHMVVNLDESIAITQNYVSTANLADCLKFLKFKKDQISGVRDREGGNEFADSMYDEFLKLLQIEVPFALDRGDVKRIVSATEEPKKRSLFDKVRSSKRFKTDSTLDDTVESTSGPVSNDSFTFSFSV